MKKTNVILGLSAIGLLGGYAYYSNKAKAKSTNQNTNNTSNNGIPNVAVMRQQLIQYFTEKKELGTANKLIPVLTELEVQYVYYYVFTYSGKLTNAPANFQTAIPAILKKYSTLMNG